MGGPSDLLKWPALRAGLGVSLALLVKVMFARAGLLVVALSFAAPHAVWAQTEGKFALGGQVSKRASTGPDAHGHLGIGLVWRIGHSKTGFGWDFALNWFSADVDRSIGGIDTDLGEVQIRPIMAGYGYTHVIGKTAVSAKALAGYAFSSATLSSQANDAYRDRLGARAVTIDASNTIVLKPELGVWHDLSKKMGLRASVGYMVARPQIVVASTLGEDKRRVNADMLMFKVGLVYSVF
jgi:outer membrane protein with beta-barrel domain